VDERAHSSDHQDHQHRQLVELERRIDVQIADRHPAEVALDERGGWLRTGHRLPDPKCQQE
jgi:hypothetical protein